MYRQRFLLLSFLSGLLLIPAWYEIGRGIILLIAFIPLLYVEYELTLDKINQRPHKAFLYAGISFLTWNAGTTWWLWNASVPGMFVAMIVNAASMALVFWAFHITHRNTGPGTAYFSLIVYWIAYEHFYMYGEINWPWLVLGNGFANDIHVIQWYEYTGALGGSLWVLLSNVIGFHVLRHYSIHRALKGKIRETGIWVTVLLIPVFISLVRFSTYEVKEDPREFVILQPNIDPYGEKFGGLDMMLQMQILLNLADSLGTVHTDYFVAPETFINDRVWLHAFWENRSIRAIREFIHEKYPGAAFVVGFTGYQLYPDAGTSSGTAQACGNTGQFYDTYNTAVLVDTTDRLQLYKKSKLVIGVETMPYREKLAFLQNLMIHLGGTFRSHGVQEERNNLYSADSMHTGGSPVICYESIFGEFVGDYIKLGSDFIFVLTNDGWWGDTPGYRQHHSYSRLRAIETRRSVARSANTGISSLINQKGQILQRTDYREEDALRGTLNANRELTFYTRHGDYLARISYFFAILTLIITLIRILIHRRG